MYHIFTELIHHSITDNFYIYIYKIKIKNTYTLEATHQDIPYYIIYTNYIIYIIYFIYSLYIIFTIYSVWHPLDIVFERRKNIKH